MSEVYLKEDASKLLLNKFVVVLGDSIHRSIYKDLVILLQKDHFLNDRQLRCKGEYKFENDALLSGGRKREMNNGPNYREVREYKSDYHLIRFYFVTRCYNKYVEAVFKELSEDPKPDVIIMNSCLWDITRYGPNSVPEYKLNLKKLCELFSKSLLKECLVLWNACMPVSKDASGGFLIPELEFLNSTLRLDILEANFYAQEVVSAQGYDVLDLHYFLRHHLHRRAEDGIHWDMTAHRRITNLILTHIAEAWGEPLPGRLTEALKTMKTTNTNITSINKGGEWRKKRLMDIPYHPPQKENFPSDNYIYFDRRKKILLDTRHQPIQQENFPNYPSENDTDFDWQPYHDYHHQDHRSANYHDHWY